MMSFKAPLVKFYVRPSNYDFYKPLSVNALNIQHSTLNAEANGDEIYGYAGSNTTGDF